MEYKEDYAAHKMIVTLAPRPISSYIGQASFKGPVTLAYDTLQNTDSNYVLNLVDSVGHLVTEPLLLRFSRKVNSASLALSGAMHGKRDFRPQTMASGISA